MQVRVWEEDKMLIICVGKNTTERISSPAIVVSNIRTIRENLVL